MRYFDFQRARAYAAPAIILLILLAPTLLYPYGRDQSVFAWVGTVVAGGGMPYRDAWDLKPPGIYLAYAAPALLARGAALMTLIRAIDLVLAAASALLLAALVRRWAPEKDRSWASSAAGAWYAALYLGGTFWSLAQAESWANPLVLGAALLCVRAADREHPDLRSVGAAGALAGAAAVLKFTAVLPLAPFFWAVLCPSPYRVPRAAALLGGCLLPPALAAAWLSGGGAWSAYLEIQSGFVSPYSRLNAEGPGRRIANLFGHTSGWMLRNWLPLLLAGTALAIRSCWAKRESRRQAAAMLLAGLAAVWIQNKYFGYHWQAALPALSVLAALGSGAVLRRAGLPDRALLAAALSLAVAWSLVGWGSHYRDAVLLAAGRISREQWLVRFGREHGGDYSFLATEKVSRFVREHSAPGEKVLVWGFEPGVYLLSGRQPPTRFFFNVPVAARFAPESWRQEYLEALRARPPEMVLVLRNDAIPWANGRAEDSAAQLRSWPELERWLRNGYRFEKEIEDFAVYRRRTGWGPPFAAEAAGGILVAAPGGAFSAARRSFSRLSRGDPSECPSFAGIRSSANG